MNIQPHLGASPVQSLLPLDFRFPAWPVQFGTPATPTDQMVRQSELRRLGRKLRDLRRNRAASLIEAEAQTVIKEIFAMGPTA